jgi:exonuclease III
MLIHCWNVRGLKSPLKQHEVISLMKKQHIDVCGLLETKLLSSLCHMYKFRLKH